MEATAKFLKFYKGYDGFRKLAGIENFEKKDIPELTLKFINFYKQNIPYSDRPVFLDKFNRMINTDGYELKPDDFEQIQNFFLETVVEHDSKNYLYLMEESQLFENCQIRGEVFAESIDLSLIIQDKEVKLSWDKTEAMAEDFLKNEPAFSIPFYEKYFYAYANTYSKENTKLSTAKLFELAEKVLNYSTDHDALRYAWLIKHDDEFLRKYKKETFDTADLQDLKKLESLENDLIAEFGEISSHTHFSSKGGRMLVNVLSREKKEERREQKLYQQRTIADISIQVKSKEKYCKGYKAYLAAIVYFGTDDLKKGISSLEEAYQFGFDPGATLEELLRLYTATNKKENAAEVAEKLLLYESCSNYDESRNDDVCADYIVALENAGRKPFFLDDHLEQIITENKSRIDNYIKSLSEITQQKRELITKERIESGITLFDSLIKIKIGDEAIQKNQDIEQIIIDINNQQFLELSLEELNLFYEAGQEELKQVYEGKINYKLLVDYVNKLRIKYQAENEADIDLLIKTFPNLCASVLIGKQIAKELIQNEAVEDGKKLLNHVFEKRNQKADLGFIEPVNMLVDIYNSESRYHESIDLLKKGLEIFGDKESILAKNLLKNTYLSFIDFEKSPVKRNKILSEAEAQSLHLNDDRFRKLRNEINNQLNKRKKIIMIASGITVVIVVIVVLIFTL